MNSDASRSHFPSPVPSPIALPSMAPRWPALPRLDAGPRAPPTRPRGGLTMARKIRRFIPRLEAFAERCLPSVDRFGGALFITGDDTANTVVVTDDGAGNVLVTMDGTAFPVFTGVTSITIQTFGGRDTVDYTLTGDLVGRQTVVADLGRQVDTFTAHVSDRTVLMDSKLIIQAFGDGGGDQLTLDAQNVSGGANSTFEVDLVGGKAKDVFVSNYTPGVVDVTATVAINLQQKDPK